MGIFAPDNRSIRQPPRLMLGLNIALAVFGALGVASLVFLYGGFHPDALPLSPGGLLRLQQIIVGYFVFDRLLRLVVSRPRLAYLRDNWLDYALILLLGIAMGLAWKPLHDMMSAGTLFVIITQAYLLAVLALRAINANLRLAGSGLPPAWLLLGSFGAACLIGAGLLMLPAAVRPEFQGRWYFPDALFTAVSATCVTGLVVVDTGTHFTPFGQAVILTLIQLGGLGIMIFGTVLGLLAGKALSMRGHEALGEMLSEDRLGELGRVIRFVVVATLLIEAAGALMLLPMFSGAPDAFGQPMDAARAAWHATFHSISAFCNAGFALYSNNMMHGVREGWSTPLREHWQILGVLAPLIMLGGIGFPVLQDLLGYVRSAVRRMRFRREGVLPLDIGQRPRLSLHSKLALLSSLVLIVGGAVGLWLVHFDLAGQADKPALVRHEGMAIQGSRNDWESLGHARRMRAYVFQSITARTAGFNTIDMDELPDAGKLWMCMLMTIGGSPGSTAGGVKTVTIAIIAVAVWSILRQRGDLEAFGRRIPEALLRKAATLLFLYVLVVLLVTILLSMSMPRERFIDVLFEACSACGTVGLSTGVTGRLETFQKFVIIAGMYIGRIGPLTLIVALGGAARPARYTYPSENTLIG